MTVHPEIQAKAQVEIDRLTGRTRLPTFEDRQDLPYVERIVWECIRWNPGGWLLPERSLCLEYLATDDNVRSTSDAPWPGKDGDEGR